MWQLAIAQSYEKEGKLREAIREYAKVGREGPAHHREEAGRRIQELQRIMQRSLKVVNEAVCHVEKGYFGNRKQVFFSGWPTRWGRPSAAAALKTSGAARKSAISV